MSLIVLFVIAAVIVADSFRVAFKWIRADLRWRPDVWQAQVKWDRRGTYIDAAGWNDRPVAAAGRYFQILLRSPVQGDVPARLAARAAFLQWCWRLGAFLSLLLITLVIGVLGR